jgi:hypothetical protein
LIGIAAGFGVGQVIGVDVRGPNNTIGGTAAGATNIIAFNRFGVRVLGSTSTGNRIQRNSTFSNTQLAIDLVGTTGITLNDVDDPDAGPNNLQNFPEMSSAVLSGGNVIITYSVSSSTTNSAYPLTVEFYRADASGRQGAALLGSESYPAPGVDSVTVASGGVVAGDRVVGTATDNNGNTSEFSLPVTVTTPLMAAGGESGTSSSAPLTTDQLQPIVDAAIERLSSQGLSSDQLAALSSVSFAIADLSGATLGLASPRTITIDATAAGHGWFVDSTPLDDVEFESGSTGSEVAQRMDLLTAVMHELGHTLGLGDLHDHGDEDDLMYEELAVGVRRASLEAAVDAVFGAP